jgi:hypothetical protein
MQVELTLLKYSMTVANYVLTVKVVILLGFVLVLKILSLKNMFLESLNRSILYYQEGNH